MKRVLWVSLFLVAQFLTLTFAQDYETRTWTSEANSSGKVFTAQGYLKEVVDNGESVILVIKGKEKKVEVKRLSSIDQKYIQRIIEKDKNNEISPPKEGDTFSFYDKQLPVLRPVYGIYLGESINSLSQRADVTEITDLVQCYQVESHYMGGSEPYKYSPEVIKTLYDHLGILKCYDVEGTDDDADAIHVYTVKDRILCIYVFQFGRSDEIWNRSNDVVDKKYPFCDQHKNKHCDTTNKDFHIGVSVDYALEPNARSSATTRHGKKFISFNGETSWNCYTPAVIYQYLDMCETALDNLPKNDFEEKM